MSGDDLILEEPCPLCKAEPGEPCRTISEPFHPLTWSHLERIRAHYRSFR